MAEHSVVLAQGPAPPSPRTVVIDVGPGQIVGLPVPAPETALAIDGNDVLVAQPEAPPIVLRNLVELAQADPPPVVQLADAAIAAPDLISRLASVDAMRVDALLQSLPAGDVPPPGRLAPQPDLLAPDIGVADGSGSPFAVRGDLPTVQPIAAALPHFLPSIPPDAEPIPAAKQTDATAQLLATMMPADNDTILGSPGDDRVATDGSPSFIDLGDGTDTLDLSAVATLDLGTRDYNGIEKIDLGGRDGSEITLTAADLLDLSPSTDTLLVRGNAADQVVIGGGWTAAGTQNNPQGETGTFTVYTQSVGGTTATLLVESSVSVA